MGLRVKRQSTHERNSRIRYSDIRFCCPASAAGVDFDDLSISRRRAVRALEAFARGFGLTACSRGMAISLSLD